MRMSQYNVLAACECRWDELTLVDKADGLWFIATENSAKLLNFAEVLSIDVLEDKKVQVILKAIRACGGTWGFLHLCSRMFYQVVL